MSSTSLFQNIDAESEFKYNFEEFEKQFDLEFENRNFNQLDNTFFFSNSENEESEEVVKSLPYALSEEYLLDQYDLASVSTKELPLADAEERV